MGLIEYTAYFATNQTAPPGIQISNVQDPNRKWYNPIGRLFDSRTGQKVQTAAGPGGAYTVASRSGIFNTNNKYNTATLNSGGIMSRLRWNTGTGSKVAQQGFLHDKGKKAGQIIKSGANSTMTNNKASLTFGSKFKIGATGLGTGLVAGKITGNLAKTRAQEQAAKAGLMPGTPEYKQYVEAKAKQGKWLGRLGGAVVGSGAMRLLGKNSFKVKR